MEATIHYGGGETREFSNVEDIETVNDIAYIDGIMQTDVEDVEIGA